MKEMLQLAQWWRMAVCTRTGDVRVRATGVVATAYQYERFSAQQMLCARGSLKCWVE